MQKVETVEKSGPWSSLGKLLAMDKYVQGMKIVKQ